MRRVSENSRVRLAFLASFAVCCNLVANFSH